MNSSRSKPILQIAIAILFHCLLSTQSRLNAQEQLKDASTPRALLRVHSNRHQLADQNDKPFFWLGDTAWELIHRLNRNQVDSYLDTRQKQQFNVIQTVCLAEFDGLVAYSLRQLLDSLYLPFRIIVRTLGLIRMSPKTLDNI